MPAFLERLKLPDPSGRRQLLFRDAHLIWILETALILGLGLWLSLTPVGFWGKLWAIAYSSCHQISARSFFHAGHQSPFCARCTGMYLGAGIGLIFTALQGRRIRWPRPGVLAVLALFLLLFAIDGLNSFAQFIPGPWQIYASSNTLRLLTGLGLGLGIAAIALPIFNRALWAGGEERPVLGGGGLAALILILGALAWMILKGWGPALLFSFFFTPLAFTALLILLYSSLVLVLMRQDGEATRWVQIYPHLLTGMLLALLQFSAISLLRFALTGSWAPMVL